MGSPPLARGPPRLASSVKRKLGITPARAGTTILLIPARPLCRDHPRSRGDHSTRFSRMLRISGSPPLARGPPFRDAERAPEVGITPARAGTTHIPNLSEKQKRDHPRSRGDHKFLMPPLACIPGSPPLARGPQTDKSVATCHLGITPARAGTTKWGCLRGTRTQDHPRSRGDHCQVLWYLMVTEGSPPLARGPRKTRAVMAFGFGITPARAGTTAIRVASELVPWDHPRSRGDHKCTPDNVREITGSPPLARGPRLFLPHPGVIVRITPARAGTTRILRKRQGSGWDHPRSRGDHPGLRHLLKGNSGSPPLARGPPSSLSRQDLFAGITPARAGTTRRDSPGCSGSQDHPRSRGDHTPKR